MRIRDSIFVTQQNVRVIHDLRFSQARQAGEGVVDFIGTFDYFAGKFFVFHFLAPRLNTLCCDSISLTGQADYADFTDFLLLSFESRHSDSKDT